ncbi:MAG: ATP-binding protein [Planctomycetota bacterium]
MILRTIRARVAGLYLLLLAAVFVLFGAFLFFYMRQLFYEELDGEVLEETEEITAAFVRHTRASAPSGVREFEREFLSALPRRTVVDIRGPAGRPPVTLPMNLKDAAFAAIPDPPRAEAPPIRPFTVSIPGAPAWKDGHRAFANRFLDDAGNAWVCRFATPLRPVRERLEHFVRRYIAASLFLYLLFLGGGWLLARRALEPVERIAEAARRIGRTTLHARVPVPEPRDEIRALAETLNGLLGRVEEAFREVERVTADAAHELRTPIARMRTEIELAIGRTREPRGDAETFESLLSGASRLARLVDDLLLLARSDAGAIAPRLEPVAVGPLLETVRETAEVLGAPRGIRVALEAVPPGLSARGEAGMLERILLNLAHNGILYNRDGGTLSMSAAASEGFVRIRIADEGGGIPKDRLPFLFRRFYRADEARSPGKGSGLGLAIADALARAHGGRIDVESEPGKGSAFTVVLPAAGASEPSAA